MLSHIIEAYNYLRDFLYTIGDTLFPVIFLTFFLFGAIAIWYEGKMREFFIGSVVFLVLTSSILGVYMIPAVHAQRYSDLVDQKETYYDIVIVDSVGEEIPLDERATNPVRVGSTGNALANQFGNEKRLDISAKIINDAKAYQKTVSNPWPRISHPPNRAGTIWDKETFNDYAKFDRLRVYETTIVYEKGSHHIKYISEECIVEIAPDKGTITEEC